jgi:parvulin-like peptidyl-prolyl isomerase
LSLAGTFLVQQKLSPVLSLTASALVAAVLVSSGAAQEWTPFPEDGQAEGYGPARPYLPASQPVVPGPPIQPTQPSRPASWPGTPAAARQWDPQTSLGSAQGRAWGYPRSSPDDYPGDGWPPAPGERRGYGQPAPAITSPGGYPAKYPQIPNAVQTPYPQMPNAMGTPNWRIPNAVGIPWAEGGFEQQSPAPAQMEPCEGALILARVGSEVVLASEVLPAVNEVIARYKDRIPPNQLELQRRLLIEQQLAVPIETKLIYLDARRTIPKENLPRIEEKLGEEFEKTELKKMLKSAGVDTRRELDRKLRSMGTSLERRKQAFIQRALAQSWVHQQVNLDEEVTYDQMLEYYRQHLAEFEKPARARWEELMARFSEYPTREEAYAATVRMGNQVRAGVPWAEVARSLSNGTTASEGGLRDWTHRGSLVCEQLDQALFGLPVGELSPILESENGLHIIRVTERELAGRVPFADAQAAIRPKIRQERAKQQLRAYVARLREQIPVWSIFDNEARDEQLSGRGGPPRR